MVALSQNRIDFAGPSGRLSVRTIGATDTTNTPILFVHPINLQGRAWYQVARRLSSDRLCIFPDMRAHGTSEANGPLGTEYWAADCIAALDHLGIAKVHVIGGSAGGPIAVYLAANFPDRVQSIVACGSSLGRAGKGPNVIRELLQEMDVETMFRTLIPDISLAPGTAESIVELTLALSNPNDPATVEAVWTASGQTDVRPIVGNVRCPATVITGALDATSQVDAGSELATALDTDVIVLEHIGHLPMLEAPELLTSHLRDHLQRVELAQAQR